MALALAEQNNFFTFLVFLQELVMNLILISKARDVHEKLKNVKLKNPFYACRLS